MEGAESRDLASGFCLDATTTATLGRSGGWAPDTARGYESSPLLHVPATRSCPAIGLLSLTPTEWRLFGKTSFSSRRSASDALFLFYSVSSLVRRAVKAHPKLRSPLLRLLSVASVASTSSRMTSPPSLVVSSACSEAVLASFSAGSGFPIAPASAACEAFLYFALATRRL